MSSKPYEELTADEKAEICNGCGGKGSWIRPPHGAFFEASCNHHDYGYWRGGTEADRKKCDKAFKNAMIRDCARLNWFQWLRYRPWVEIYYRAVRFAGRKFFFYTEKPREIW